MENPVQRSMRIHGGHFYALLCCLDLGFLYVLSKETKHETMANHITSLLSPTRSPTINHHTLLFCNRILYSLMNKYHVFSKGNIALSIGLCTWTTMTKNSLSDLKAHGGSPIYLKDRRAKGSLIFFWTLVESYTWNGNKEASTRCKNTTNGTFCISSKQCSW